MEFKTLDEVLERAIALPQKRKMVIANANDSHSIELAAETKKMGIADAILIGDPDKISDQLKENGQGFDFEILPSYTPEESAGMAVDIIREGKADFLVKGMLETSQMLRPVVNKETGIGTGRVMSHLSVNELPSYHKLITITDGGMFTYPTLDQKKEIVKNAVDAFHALGYELPKVACLAAVEVVNPKMLETVEAREIEESANRGELGTCYVKGPISYDIAMSAEIAAYKKFDGKHCGDFDILLVPNIHTGNILGKSWAISAGGTFAGVVVGAKVPIVITSRASSSQEKLRALALAVLLSGMYR
ncbi:MAG: phosphate butyryltransferase [Clostridiales bacterium]|nr:phosphate butyryltransferase [Clostridiales bacterium]